MLNINFQKEFNKKVREYKESLLTPLLAQCTETQKDVFRKMYKNITTMKETSMPHAYSQIQRTLQEKINDV